MALPFKAVAAILIPRYGVNINIEYARNYHFTNPKKTDLPYTNYRADILILIGKSLFLEIITSHDDE
ncbi:hypothetical protein CFP56_021174 [Quercus suber]|uniref:Uncharacterized protein n=1 Tax=Quercus suber TaxID=58331 RepID=A0AAW0KDK8_QUESU